MKNIEIIYNQVANSINDRDDAFTFIKDEIRAALNGSYEANYFARKSQIKINDSPPEEIPYSSDTPQAILTNLLNELTSTRDAVLIRLKIIDRVMKKFRFGKYQDSVSKNNIRIMCEDRQIENLIHFTKVENLSGIFNLGLMSKEYMDQIGQSFSFNDHERVDGQLNAISLSISFPNYKMFYKYRMQDRAQRWAVILLSPSVLWEEDCLFSKHNAADSRIRNISDRLGKPSDFESMFLEDDNHIMSELRKCDPIDPQAEVLVFNNIDSRNIIKIIVEREEDIHLIKESINFNCTTSIIVDERYFQSRMYSLRNF